MENEIYIKIRLTKTGEFVHDLLNKYGVVIGVLEELS